jgi:hypothetical protein
MRMVFGNMKNKPWLKPKPTCEGKVVEVDGVKYGLVKVWLSKKIWNCIFNEKYIYAL